MKCTKCNKDNKTSRVYLDSGIQDYCLDCAVEELTIRVFALEDLNKKCVLLNIDLDEKTKMLKQSHTNFNTQQKHIEYLEKELLKQLKN